MDIWPISQAEAARRVGVSAAVASLLIRSHNIPTQKFPGGVKYSGLTPEAFERFREVASPFRRKPGRVAVSPNA